MKTLLCTGLAIFASVVILTSALNATPPPPPADLSVSWQGPSAALVNSPYVYTVKVLNTGGTASNVTAVVNFPLTNTSPTRSVLGKLSGVPSNCSVRSNRLECNLGTLKRNKSASFTFNFEIPVTTQNFVFSATAATTSAESNTGNNSSAFTPNLTYQTINLTGANVLNSHCTGTNLTSYFECELFPSSISTHTAQLLSDGSIDLGEPGYGGNWYQPSPQQLHFDYTENGNIVATFDGFVSSANCFEGITTFPQNPNYNSAYKVCIQ